MAAKKQAAEITEKINWRKKRLTNAEKLQLTQSVGKQIMEICEKNNCIIRVWASISDDGRIAANMSISVKD